MKYTWVIEGVSKYGTKFESHCSYALSEELALRGLGKAVMEETKAGHTVTNAYLKASR